MQCLVLPVVKLNLLQNFIGKLHYQTSADSYNVKNYIASSRNCVCLLLIRDCSQAATTINQLGCISIVRSQHLCFFRKLANYVATKIDP